jgi:hypothetical protein
MQTGDHPEPFSRLIRRSLLASLAREECAADPGTAQPLRP